MTWTAPRTWVTAEVITSQLFNAQIRDDLLETAAAKATTAGDLFYASAANAVARLGIGAAGKYLGVTGGLPAWRDGYFIKYKTADENLGGTLAGADDDDTHLRFTPPVVGDSKWWVRWVIRLTPHATEITYLSSAIGSGAVSQLGSNFWEAAGANFSGAQETTIPASTEAVAICTAGGGETIAVVHGFIALSGTTWITAFAHDSGSGTNAIKKGSYMEAFEVTPA